MAMFKTHIAGSTILGIGYGGAAFAFYHLPAPACLLGAGLCSVSGMLPDIDSGPGRPLREITTFMASVIPTMLLGHLLAINLSQESVVLIGAAIYVAIRFGLATFLRHYTVHRGMFHSFPALVIFGELTYLLFYSENTFLRIYLAAAVMAGFFSHLLLDEIYSVEWDGRPRIKRTFGTAMKFTGEGWWPNVTAYAKLILLTLAVLKDPNLVQQLYTGGGNQLAGSVKQGFKEHSTVAIPFSGGERSPQAATANMPGGRPRTNSMPSSAPTGLEPTAQLAWPSSNQVAPAPPTDFSRSSAAPPATIPASKFTWPTAVPAATPGYPAAAQQPSYPNTPSRY
jgi:membrane-bound metal-dependent hydrolase YbcI (DUF457 family)